MSTQDILLVVTIAVASVLFIGSLIHYTRLEMIYRRWSKESKK